MEPLAASPGPVVGAPGRARGQDPGRAGFLEALLVQLPAVANVPPPDCSTGHAAGSPVAPAGLPAPVRILEPGAYPEVPLAAPGLEAAPPANTRPSWPGTGEVPRPQVPGETQHPVPAAKEVAEPAEPVPVRVPSENPGVPGAADRAGEPVVRLRQDLAQASQAGPTPARAEARAVHGHGAGLPRVHVELGPPPAGQPGRRAEEPPVTVEAGPWSTGGAWNWPVQPVEAGAPGPELPPTSSLADPGFREAVFEQVVHATRLAKSRGRDTMVLRLQPPELGEVTLRLVTTPEGVTARFVVDQPEVKALIEVHLPRLEQALTGQGLQLDDASVYGDGRQQGPYREPPQRGRGGRREELARPSSYGLVGQAQLDMTV